MKSQLSNEVNVAPSSTHGHYVVEAREVINLDTVNEMFLVEGKSKLVTDNHTTLNMDEDCLISCQRVPDPLSGFKRKVLD